MTGAFAPLLIAASTLAAQPLQLKFDKGDVALNTVTSSLEVIGKLSDKKIVQGVVFIVDSERAVVDANEEGASIRESIRRVRVLQKGDNPIELDSSGDKPDSAGFVPAYDALKELVGQKFDYKMSPAGELSEFSTSDEMKELFKSQARRRVGLMMNESILKEIYEKTTPILPSEPVEPGATWSRVMKFRTHVGQQTVEAEYTYSGAEEREGRQIEVIKVGGKVTFETDQANQKLFKIQKQNASGEIEFDSQAGRVVRSKVKAVLEMKVDNRTGFGVMEVTSIVTLEPTVEPTPGEAEADAAETPPEDKPAEEIPAEDAPAKETAETEDGG